MLEVQRFIEEHDNWEELLAAAPYNLTIKRKDTRILFKYNQIESDFSEPIVNECRGLILEDETFKVIAMAFTKFWNYGEKFAADIDWTSAKVLSKEDGSIISLYFYDGEWKVKTNSTIDAEDAPLQSGSHKNFRQLFDVAAINSKLNFDILNEKYCYTLELCSKFNPIVVPYDEPKLFHLTTRNMWNLEEIEVDIGVEKPKQYNLSSLQDCIDLAKTFDHTREGFVAIDKDYNRIKIKSEEYLRIHRFAGNGNITNERIAEIVRNNEQAEVLSYFPQYKDMIEKMEKDYKFFLDFIRMEELVAAKCRDLSIDRKDFSEKVKERALFPAIWYLVYDDKFDYDTYIRELTPKKLVKLLEQYCGGN